MTEHDRSRYAHMTGDPRHKLLPKWSLPHRVVFVREGNKTAVVRCILTSRTQEVHIQNVRFIQGPRSRGQLQEWEEILGKEYKSMHEAKDRERVFLKHWEQVERPQLTYDVEHTNEDDFHFEKTQNPGELKIGGEIENEGTGEGELGSRRTTEEKAKITTAPEEQQQILAEDQQEDQTKREPPAKPGPPRATARQAAGKEPPAETQIERNKRKRAEAAVNTEQSRDIIKRARVDREKKVAKQPRATLYLKGTAEEIKGLEEPRPQAEEGQPIRKEPYEDLLGRGKWRGKGRGSRKGVGRRRSYKKRNEKRRRHEKGERARKRRYYDEDTQL